MWIFASVHVMSSRMKYKELWNFFLIHHCFLCKVKVWMHSVNNYFFTNASFAENFKSIEYLLQLLGLNIFNPKWFRNESICTKIICVTMLSLVVVCTGFAFICAFHTYKGSLEDQLSSILAGFFALQVRWVNQLNSIQ